MDHRLARLQELLDQPSTETVRASVRLPRSLRDAANLAADDPSPDDVLLFAAGLASALPAT